MEGKMVWTVRTLGRRVWVALRTRSKAVLVPQWRKGWGRSRLVPCQLTHPRALTVAESLPPGRV